MKFPATLITVMMAILMAGCGNNHTTYEYRGNSLDTASSQEMVDAGHVSVLLTFVTTEPLAANLVDHEFKPLAFLITTGNTTVSHETPGYSSAWAVSTTEDGNIAHWHFAVEKVAMVEGLRSIETANGSKWGGPEYRRDGVDNCVTIQSSSESESESCVATYIENRDNPSVWTRLE